jgi:ATP-dependent protease ClpP protease subunit
MPRFTKENIDRFFDYGVDVANRTLYVGSMGADDCENENGTDYSMAEYTLKALHILEANGSDPIIIIMNNPGGDEYHGLAMMDAIELCKSEVTIKVFGMAMSMGSWILQVADHRLLSQHSTLMLHYGEWGNYQHALDNKRHCEEGERLRKLMEDAYLSRIQEKNPHYTRQRLKNRISTDWYIPAAEAVSLGLADGIIT